MKKLFAAALSMALILFISNCAHAQLVKSETIKSTAGVAKTSLSSTDTAYALSGVITAAHKSIEIGATKTSGTVGGKVYFQGKNLDGASWVNLDSMTVANSAGLQYKLITVPATLIYSDYRFQFLSTGGVWAPAAYTLRRN